MIGGKKGGGWFSASSFENRSEEAFSVRVAVLVDRGSLHYFRCLGYFRVWRFVLFIEFADGFCVCVLFKVIWACSFSLE